MPQYMYGSQKTSCGFWASNSGNQTWWQAPLPEKPYRRFFMEILFYFILLDTISSQLTISILLDTISKSIDFAFIIDKTWPFPWLLPLLLLSTLSWTIKVPLCWSHMYCPKHVLKLSYYVDYTLHIFRGKLLNEWAYLS